MNNLEKLNIAIMILKAKMFKKRFPLAVGWNITSRCNLRCKYCSYWRKECKELETKEIFGLVDELKRLNARFITFSGGEPLLRGDLEEIIEFTRSKNIYVVINSNGTLIKEQINKVQNANEIQLSLDGPKEIHNFIRGEGVYENVIEAIELCKKKNIRLNLVTVISNINIPYINHILGIAGKYKIGVYFQPVCLENYYPNKEDSLAPEQIRYKNTIRYLIKKKKRGFRFINNSISGLRHLFHWPNPKKIFCLANLLHCSIEPDGRIFICDAFYQYQKYLVCINGNFKKTFDKLKLPNVCRQCWCGNMVEFNLLGSFRLDTIKGILNRLSNAY